MARDYRHGHANKPGFQRKSQQSDSVTEKRSISVVWAVAFLGSAALLVGFFIVQNLASNEVKSASMTGQNILQSAVEIKQVADESIQQISEKLQPKVVMVNEVVVPESDKASIVADEQPSFSFYQGLSKTEIIVEVEPISVQLDRPYYIQAGSFGSESVAKQELKRLMSKGLDLTLSALHKPKRTYYRLRMGPFTDRLILNKRRNELRRFGVDTLLIKAALPVKENESRHPIE